MKLSDLPRKATAASCAAALVMVAGKYIPSTSIVPVCIALTTIFTGFVTGHSISENFGPRDKKNDDAC